MDHWPLSRIGVIAFLATAALSMPIAQADIVVIVNSSNPMPFDKDQIKDIFLAKKVKFPDGSVAKPADQSDGRAIRNEFYSFIANKDENEMKVYWSTLIFTGSGRPPKTLGDDLATLSFVKENTGAIGYVDSKVADASVKVVYTLK